MLKIPKYVRLRSFGDVGLAVDDAGRHFRLDSELVERWKSGCLNDADEECLNSSGILRKTRLSEFSARFQRAQRLATKNDLDYLILVPTLRCNLACSYCQVSRANENAKNFDWTDETLADVCALVTSLTAPNIQIEFQGGEPSLRPDLIQAVMRACPDGKQIRFIVCSNLQKLSPEMRSLLADERVFVSTSFDTRAAHTINRTKTEDATDSFVKNLEWVLENYGADKVSALPTIDPTDPPSHKDLVREFEEFGFSSIYLRHINFHGFARKTFSESLDISSRWNSYYSSFIDFLIDRNFRSDHVMEESYMSIVLRRILRPGQNSHVDLRNPNPIGRDYIVIDYDGTAYPSDEARMLSRSGIIDLQIGDAKSGWNTEARDALDAVSTNVGDPDCDRCAYQLFCGRDIFDDLSRYGTLKVPRPETHFCQTHMAIFDKAFLLLFSDDAKIRYSLKHWLGLREEPALCGEMAA